MMSQGIKTTLFLLFSGLLVSGQTKQARIEVQKYTISADINPRTQSISATAKIEFTPLEATNDVTFELNNALAVGKGIGSKVLAC